MKTEETTRSLDINGKEYSYLLLKRKGQKYIRLKVGKDGAIIVSAPHTAGLHRIDKLIEEKKGWIQKHIEKYRTAAVHYDPLTRIPYCGEWFEVEHVESKLKGTARIDIEHKKCIISSQTHDPGELKEILRRRFTLTAKKSIPGIVEKWSKALRIPYTSISIRNQKTRWGSSSGRGQISINWRILCTPQKVQDYLIVHELLHQRQHNHSPAYWKELEQIFPGAKDCDNWLKQHSMIMSLLRD